MAALQAREISRIMTTPESRRQYKDSASQRRPATMDDSGIHGSQYIKTGGDNLPDIPALDTIPTNEFVGNILADPDVDEDDKGDIRLPVGDKTGQTSSTIQETQAPSRKGSGSVKSAKLRVSVEVNEDDVDTETVLDIKERFPPYDGTGQLAYEKACAKFHTLPISSFHKKLAESTSIDIRYYGVGPNGAKAIAIPMVINSRVTALNLAGNNLTSEGLEHIVKMMVENDFITQLNLSDNNLKTEGAKLLCEMLHLNDNLEVLDISENGFTSYDATILCEAVENHIHLKVLNMSKNEFGEESGKALGSMISETASLRELDLSWNQIRGKAATEIAKGLKENICLKYLDMSWNGFGNKGCVELAEALSSCTLTELNLESNRVGAEGVLALCKALPDTDEIKTLKLGKNPLPEDFAVAALEYFLSVDDLHLEHLDLSDMIYTNRFKETVDAVKMKHEHFNCKFGYSDSYGIRRLKSYNAVGEAVKAIKNYCENNGISIGQLFHRLDSDGSLALSYDEFKTGLKEARIPITDGQIQALISSLDQDGDGELDFSEIVLGIEKFKD